MANTIILKKSSTASSVPAAGSLQPGELAVNLADKKLYTKTVGGTVILLADGNAAASGGTVTSVDVSGGTTGLSFSGGPVTTSGTITMAGTLSVTNGGTGANTLTSGYLVKGNGTSAVSASVIYDNGTNVGIGTSSPGSILDITAATPTATIKATTTTGTTIGNKGNRLNLLSNSYTVGNGGEIIWSIADTDIGRWAAISGSITANSAGGARGAITFATKANNADTALTERMRIDASGNIGIGTSSPGGKLDVTGSSGSVVVNAAGDQISYTFNGFNYLTASGAAATLQIQASGASGKLTFATAGSERMRIDSSGNIGFNSTSLGGGSGTYRFAGNVTGATTSVGILYTPTVSSDVTGVASVFLSQPSTQAAAFTLGDLRHFQANQGTIGASSAVTSQYGFYAGSALTGATNNYAFYGGIASGTGRWNLYMAGTAANYLAGSLSIGVASTAADLVVGGASGGNRTIQVGSAGATRGVISTDAANGIFSIGATNDSTTGILTFKTGSALTEYLRIGPSGQIGLSGANYGTSGQVLTSNGSGSAPTWQATTNQTITLSGDATGSGSTAITVTLANSGVTAGTYTKVTVDAKGRVTTGASLASGDLPTYTGTLTSTQVTTALGYTPYNSTNPSGYISANQTITLSGDVTGSGSTAITATLANSGVTAGSYTNANITVDAKGRITAASNGAAGGVTSVDVSGGTTGLSFSGGPITSSGTITMGGTLGVANGGTGTSTALTPGSIVFAGSSGVYTQDNANLFWDDTNNRLGIGTNAPIVNSKLHIVDGYIAIQNTTDTSGFPAVAGRVGTNQRWVVGSDHAINGNADHALSLWSGGATNMRFYTDNVERMQINSVGNVGIGTTSPQAAFDVNGDAIFRNTIYAEMITPISKSAGATLTGAEIMNGTLVQTGSGPTVTLPTAANLQAAMPAGVATLNDISFDWTVLFGGSSGLTIALNTGITNGGISPHLSLAVSTTATFRFRKTGTNTFVIYRT